LKKASSIVIAAALITACMTAVALNVFFETGTSMLFLYIPGSLLYALLGYFSQATAISRLDYHQSGEGGIAFLATVLTAALLTERPLLIFIFIFLAMMFHNTIMEKILYRDNRDRFIYGTLINIVVIIITAYLVNTGTRGPEKHIHTALTGYLHTSDHSITRVIIYCLVILIFSVLFFLLKPELKAFSLGKEHCLGAGINYRAMSCLIPVFYNLVFSLVFITIGYMGGTALYFFQSQLRSGRMLSAMVMTVLYSQLLLLVLHFSGTNITVLISLCMSYTFTIILAARRRYVPV
jgi:hypothetical protein